jgi:hypothetical protein
LLLERVQALVAENRFTEAERLLNGGNFPPEMEPRRDKMLRDIKEASSAPPTGSTDAIFRGLFAADPSLQR